MKYQNLIDMLTTLLTRKSVTAKELSEKYNICQRSVYRYIEDLIIAGVPIETARGRYGGFYIPETYRLPSGFFTRDEYAAAINALTAMNDQINDKNTLSALEKLQSSRRGAHREYVCGNIIVDGGSWGDQVKFSDKMKICERAVNENLCLSIDYISRDGEHSKRVIDPHVLILKRGVWYVYAFCHTKQQFRTFKIGRIKRAELTGKSFEKREFSREDIPLDFYYDETALLDVTLSIEGDSLPDVEEWLGIENIEPRGKGLVARVKLPDDELLVNKILGYGGAVKVLEPAALKRRVKEAAQKLVEMY